MQAPAPSTAGEKCFLLKLAPELRNRIWEYTVYSDDDSRPGVVKIERRDQGSQRIPHGVQPPITRTNRQIRAEATPIFYSTATFELRTNILNSYYCARKWISTNSHHLPHLRALNVYGWPRSLGLAPKTTGRSKRGVVFRLDIKLKTSNFSVERKLVNYDTPIKRPRSMQAMNAYVETHRQTVEDRIGAAVADRERKWLTSEEWRAVFYLLCAILDWRERRRRIRQ